MRQESVADYLRQLESLRERGIRVGVAPHSVRACPRDWLEELGRYAAANELPLHVHADEQPREIEECLAEHGLPADRAARGDRLPRRADDRRPRHPRRRPELDLLAAERRDGLRLPDDRGRPRRRLPRRPPGSSTGESRSASAPTRTSASTRSRSCGSSRASRGGRPGNAASSRTERLLCFGADEGARALGLESWPEIEIDLGHRSLRGRRRGDVFDALVAGCGADVVRPAMIVPPTPPRNGPSSRRCGRGRRVSAALPGQPPRAVVALVPLARGAGRLDLRPLVPLVVARDRDEVGARADGAAPHRVVGRAVAPRPDACVAGRAPRVVARPDRRRAEQAQPPRLPAQAREERRRRRGGRRRCRARRSRRRAAFPARFVFAKTPHARESTRSAAAQSASGSRSRRRRRRRRVTPSARR